MRGVDLNCDMGESFGRYTLGYDDYILEYISSANIACGMHAGDPPVINRTAAVAAEKGVALGAHPSYPDLQGFGRRPMVMDHQELKEFLLYQIGAVDIFVRLHGQKLQHVKPHGALNNMGARDKALAGIVAEATAAAGEDLILTAPAGSQLEKAGQEKGLRVASEFFADRGYDPEGYLLPRNHPNAYITDEEECVKRTIGAIKEGKFTAFDGNFLRLKINTICLHGDSLSAVKFAETLRKGLIEEGIEIKPMRFLV